MPIPAEAVAEDLKALRKGRGLRTTDLQTRVGTALRDVVGLTGEQDVGRLRIGLAQWLRDQARGLPSDLRTCVVAAFGLEPEADLPFYQDRVRWAARQLNRDDRTARRRIDDGIKQIAELAVEHAEWDDGHDTSSERTGAWRTKDLRVVLSLNQERPEAYEFRKVIADRDGLTELELSWTMTADPRLRVPLPTDQLPVDVLYGGQLVTKQLETADRIGLTVLLADPLNRGEVHELAMRFRAPDDREMRPHYVCTPLRPCDHFELLVHFPPNRLPDYVWLLEGVLQGDIEDRVAPRKVVQVNDVGEVKVEFRRLAPNLSYGVRWDYLDTTS